MVIITHNLDGTINTQCPLARSKTGLLAIAHELLQNPAGEMVRSGGFVVVHIPTERIVYRFPHLKIAKLFMAQLDRAECDFQTTRWDEIPDSFKEKIRIALGVQHPLLPGIGVQTNESRLQYLR